MGLALALANIGGPSAPPFVPTYALKRWDI